MRLPAHREPLGVLVCPVRGFFHRENKDFSPQSASGSTTVRLC
jgi:hypothetical protein